jgi:hypothetical protein
MEMAARGLRCVVSTSRCRSRSGRQVYLGNSSTPLKSIVRYAVTGSCVFIVLDWCMCAVRNCEQLAGPNDKPLRSHQRSEGYYAS